MLRFANLRLAGFKSFVDATELGIESGLTGIVGPNGCGKSNLVEALRWVMGETSAKQMRGGEMDDVIFGGTNDRPARNVAEVTLDLDNAERSAPAAFNDSDRIEVGRRIERAKGSTYRVNGREVRARDVQLLFADAATGARSAAIISQGQVGRVIGAKPAERRALLEEAAGITGLHSRRHEAELRLRGAESNLERLDDVLAALEGQLAGLKKQARQASRYRNLSGEIRKAEASVVVIRWRRARSALAEARARLGDTERAVADCTGRAAGAAARQAEAASAMPDLRQAEAAAAAELQRVTLAHEGLEAEERRAAADAAACRVRLDQVAADLERERGLAADADAALARLAGETSEIEAACDGEDEARSRAAAAVSAATGRVEDLEARFGELSQRLSADEARRAALDRAIADLEARRQRLALRVAEIDEQRRALSGAAADDDALAAGEAAVAGARAALESARARVQAAEAARAAAAAASAEAAARAQDTGAALAGLEAERRALAELLAPDDREGGAPLIDSVAAEAGFEAALAAALGDDLSAPADEAAAVRWRTLPPLAEPPPLPAGVRPLAEAVRAPEALARRLALTGIVEADADGAALQASLEPGQRLVSRTGALWRWDGYVVSAEAKAPAAVRLAQRRRLDDLDAEIGEARAAAEAGAEAAAAARAAEAEAAEAERAARGDGIAAEQGYAEARDADAERREAAAARTTRLAALGEAAEAVAADLADAGGRLDEAERERRALPETTAVEAEVAALRPEVAEARAALIERRAALDTLEREAEGRRRRLAAVAADAASWRSRRDAAEQHVAALLRRRGEVTVEMERLAALPDEIAERRRALLSQIEASEGRRSEAADRLADAEHRLVEADRAARAAEAALAEAREGRVRAEAAVEQADQAGRAIAERAAERFDTTPDGAAEIAGIDPDFPPAADAERVEADFARRLDRLQRERDGMGPVNLRAEQEATELSEQIETLTGERADLVTAIGKLRQGIAELNREGRERLLASFGEVDRHFQELFVRLFGGGRAHLALTESDDPLEAGLEIMASPPGKRLQILSLLSGGEQALTALALVFAVFLTNPAPICVLDEVDAPLDDANVDRFCTLLEEMTANGTRFLIITHHRMTMARMHRLFGVTMAERGVSQLVSVDLRRAEALRETA